MIILRCLEEPGLFAVRLFLLASIGDLSRYTVKEGNPARIVPLGSEFFQDRLYPVPRSRTCRWLQCLWKTKAGCIGSRYWFIDVER